ncbi:MAG: NAD(P)-dependent oxidoreductase, partial [Verrucomicrobiota bacterium]
REHGIPVSNVPEYSTDTVAQFTFGLILELCHRIGHHDLRVKVGEWPRRKDFCFWDFPLHELAGRTLGLIGYGRIGQRVGELASAFKMNLLVNTRTRRDDMAEWVETDTLFAQADIVSLHCPQTEDNLRFVNADKLSLMKPSAFFINTARGLLVHEQDLADALNSERIAGAAVDVVSAEPIADDNPLLTAKNCIITPHMAWATGAARERLMRTTTENVRAFIEGKPIHVVNP